MAAAAAAAAALNASAPGHFSFEDSLGRGNPARDGFDAAEPNARGSDERAIEMQHRERHRLRIITGTAAELCEPDASIGGQEPEPGLAKQFVGFEARLRRSAEGARRGNDPPTVDPDGSALGI